LEVEQISEMTYLSPNFYLIHMYIVVESCIVVHLCIAGANKYCRTIYFIHAHIFQMHIYGVDQVVAVGGNIF